MRDLTSIWSQSLTHLFGSERAIEPLRRVVHRSRRRVNGRDFCVAPAVLILETRSLLSAVGFADLMHGADSHLAGVAPNADDDHQMTELNSGADVSRVVASSSHRNSQTQYINGAPFELTWDPAPTDAASGTAQSLAAASSSLTPLSSIPQLHSNPSATAALYLDFDGHFDATWGSYTNVTTPVYDQDNDVTTFSDGELASMRDIWTLVAEDYAPFNIDVTTVQPASFANGVSMRVAIGGDGAWTGGSYGGIAYVGNFTSSIVNTVYVFPKNLSNGNAKFTAEASSHEAGHSFSLQHQSQYDASGVKIKEYYSGSGDGRAPIMGTSYYATRGLWWYGTSSTGPTIYQDDMAVISNATNAFGYRADDYLNATPLTVSGRDVSGSGIIEKTTDQDKFSFTAAAGEMNLSVDAHAGVGNLNARLELRDSLGKLLAASDPASFDFRRTITYTAATGGDYLLVVASHGGYGDVGQYTLSGTIPVPSTINTPTNLIATPLSTGQIDLSWIDNAGNEDGYVVDRSTTAGQTWTRLTVQPLPAGSTNYADTTAIAGTTHYYRVSAFNANDVSSYSNQAIATTIPTAPDTLTATPVWSDRNYLAWGNVAGETGFKIERSSGGGLVWSQIATTGADVTSYQDSGLQAASTYTYRVRATNASGDSAYSNLASATTFVAPPSSFGSNDGAYVMESWSGIYYDVRIQTGDQKIVAAGNRYSTDPNAPSDHRMAIARYNASGSADSAFGTGGMSAPALGPALEYGYGLALQTDGKAVVAGAGGSGYAVARFNTNGTLDTGFGSGGWNSIDVKTGDVIKYAYGVGLQSTGKVVVAGFSGFSSSNGADPAVLARYTATGAVDSGKTGFGKAVQGKSPGYTLSTFGGTYNRFSDVVVQPDDKIVVVGKSYSGSTGGLLVARYTANGVLDTTFNGTGYTTLLPSGITTTWGNAVTRQSDGKLVVVGYCTGVDGANDLLVARYNTNGTLDTSFGGGGYVRLDRDGSASQTSENGNEVAIQADGKIVIAGSYVVGTNPANVLVVRLNSNGTPDLGFGSSGFKIGSLPPELAPTQGLSANGVSLLVDGSIVVSGYGNWSPAGTSNSQFYHPLLMRFSGASASPSATGTLAFSAPTSLSSAFVPRAAASLPWSPQKNVASARNVQDNSIRSELSKSRDSADLDGQTSDLGLSKVSARIQRDSAFRLADQMASSGITTGADLDDLFADWNTDPLQLLSVFPGNRKSGAMANDGRPSLPPRKTGEGRAKTGA